MSGVNEESVFAEALEIEDLQQRAAFLDRACAGNPALRRNVQSLLSAYGAGQFLEPPTPGPAATTDEPIRERPGTVVGPYKLMEQIGEGGMGLVFVAEQQHPVRRMVALKVIKPGMDTRQVIARFEAERQALALMDHPNIARVLDGGETAGGRPYFVMELVKGVPITEYCDQNQVPVRQRLGLFLHVCQAVQHAHQKGIIHRDIKPSNVLVMSHDGTPLVKVIDFGVAKAVGQQLTEKSIYTQFSQLIGTPSYMSPEQTGQSGQDVDTRSDIYSLGVLLYELLTGTTPFDKERLKEVGFDELRRIIREEEPPRPSTRISTLGQAATTISTQRKTDPRRLSQLFRGELDWIVMKALEKDRNRRYETASAFAADVQRYLHDEPVQACPPSAWYRFRKFARRNKGRLAAVAGVFLAVTVMAASIGWAVGDRAARRATVAGQVRDSLNVARALLAENKLAAALQKLAEARAQLGNDGPALASLAAELAAAEAGLDRFQQFLDLIDRAHQAETAPVLEAAAADGPHGSAAKPSLSWGRRPAAAVPFLLRALGCYELLERDDWDSTLESGLLGKDQVEQVRHSAYEELLWLAEDVVQRRQEHRSGDQLSPEAAARQALVYLAKAESTRQPTRAFYALRARCHQALGEEAASQADRQRADKTLPTLALDYDLLGLTAYDARQLAEGVQAFEAALRLEPTHYWSLMWLGACLCDLGKGPADLAGAARVFTGCILKRPDNAHAYHCRALAYDKLGQQDEALADLSRAIELDPKHANAWNKRGLVYLSLGQQDKALADFARAIELDPKNATAWNNRGLVYAELGQEDKALADNARAIELDPKNARAWNNRGRVYYKLGQDDKALADYSRAVKLDPKLALAWYNRGLVYHRLSHQDKALADYSRAIELDPNYAPACNNRGLVYAELGQEDKALADYSRAIKLDPKLAPAWNNRGLVYHRLGQQDKALADFAKAIELDPRDAKAWINRGAVYRRLGQLDKALADYSRAIELDPKDARAWNNRGNVYVNLGQQDKALADYSRAVELDPKDAKAWFNRGIVYAELGQEDKALADYTRAIKLDPKLAPAWNNRGLVYHRLGQQDKALADFARAIELDPRDAKAWNDRGRVYAKLGQLDKALADLSRAIKLDPNLTQAWANRGAVYHRLGQLDKALADVSSAIELDPKYALAWNNRGLTYEKLGQLDKALADFSTAIELDPKDAGAWNNRGIVYRRLGQLDKALADYSRAIELDPKHAGAWYNRGFAYHNLGQHDKALADYSRAIDLDPKYALAWSNRGLAYSGVGQLDKALADCTRAIDLDPKDAGAWFYRGIVYRRLGQLDKALADYTTAIDLDPKDAKAWNNRGNVYGTLGQLDKALADFSRAIDLDPNCALAWRNRGRVYSTLRQYDKAREHFEEFLKLAPTDAEAHNNLAWLLTNCPEAKLRDPSRAVELARKAVQLDPKEANYWNTLGAAHYRAGDGKAAIAALDWSRELKKAGDAEDWFFLAMAHQKLGNHEEARKAYDQALRWLEKNQQWLAKNKLEAEEISQLRSEAEEVLQLKKK
jgi:tetratricopeptide (TPR) repeat protein